MQSLNTIQALSKAAKIISSILFVCSIVALCLCAAGALSVIFDFGTFNLENMTVKGILPEDPGMSDGTLYAFLAQTAIFCVAAIILTAFAKHYFKRELADGTPFTHGGAKELLRLGVLGAILPSAADLLATIIIGILKKTMSDVVVSDVDMLGYAAIGVALIVMSCLCKYGADLQCEKPAAQAE